MAVVAYGDKWIERATCANPGRARAARLKRALSDGLRGAAHVAFVPLAVLLLLVAAPACAQAPKAPVPPDDRQWVAPGHGVEPVTPIGPPAPAAPAVAPVSPTLALAGARGSIPVLCRLSRAVSVALHLPHLGDARRAVVLLDGAEIAAADAPFSIPHELPVKLDSVASGEHVLGVKVLAAQVWDRVLYQRTESISVAGPEASGGAQHLVFALDGVRAGPRPALATSNVGPSSGAAPAPLRMDLAVEGREPGRPVPVYVGQKGLLLTARATNTGQTELQFARFSLRLLRDGRDVTNGFLVLATEPLPAPLAPGATAMRRFRLDTFHDSIPGRIEVVPDIRVFPTQANLVRDGGFERDEWNETWRPPPLSDVQQPPVMQAVFRDARSKLPWHLGLVDWSEVTELPETNVSNACAEGRRWLRIDGGAQDKGLRGLAQAALPCPAPDATYVVGASAWNGAEVRVASIAEGGAPLAAAAKCFSGFWWHSSVNNWADVGFEFSPGPEAAEMRLLLAADQHRSWWDNIYVVAANELATGGDLAAPLALDLAATEETVKASDGSLSPVAYIGDDWETKGDWIGNYGTHCWILCAMSSPRDMVGGTPLPVKWNPRTGKRSSNRVVSSRRRGEFVYTGRTGDPSDMLIRHWIGAMRTDDRRAPENPQWGSRTYASWDDHGELHPSDWRGPDLFLELPIPEGVYVLSLYFVDWDWGHAPVPRAHRLTLTSEHAHVLCTARVTDFWDGVHKRFAVAGPRTITLRVHKDRSATVVVSGVFLDRLIPPVPPELAPGPALAEPVTGLRDLAELYQADPTAFVHRAATYADLAGGLDAALDTPPAANGRSEATWRRLACDALAALPGHPAAYERLFGKFADSLAHQVGAEKASAELTGLADGWFGADMLGRAGIAHDAALRLQQQAGSPPEDLTRQAEQLATKFAVRHIAYAEHKAAQCVGILSRERT